MTPEIFGASIVMVGAFNPAIFSPAWLNANQLLGAEDVEAANQDTSILVSQEAAICETDWFRLQVLPNQFSLSSKGALSLAVRDLAQGIASTLPHTPVTACGLNFNAHYKLDSEADYHKIGDVLAPKQIWYEAFPADHNNVGLLNLTVRVQDCPRATKNPDVDNMQIQIQPSTRMPNGVYCSINNHREQFSRQRENANAGAVAAMLASDWESAWHESETIFQAVLTRALRS